MASSDHGKRGEVPAAALKEGERVIAATRRPDGSLRKAVRIRAGYTPQEEVAIYQSKGSQFRHAGPQLPPGYDPADVPKAKTKAAKKNEKRKEKKQQTTAEAVESKAEPASAPVAPEALIEQLQTLAVGLPTASTEASPDVEKRVRALRKKIRLAASLEELDASALSQEQVEKIRKLEEWRRELQDLERQLEPSGRK